LDSGCYCDGLVTVAPRGGALPWLGPMVAATAHFEVWRQDTRLVVRHRVPDSLIDDGLTTLINDELFVPGWVAGSSIFERLFTGVVLTARPDPMDAWILFYENSFRRYAGLRGGVGRGPSGRDAIADFASIHAHADSLVPDCASVLEIGSCFGFLSLFLARRPERTVIASDISPGTVRLLSAVAERLPVPIQTLVADAARIPRPGRSIDVVLLIHLLEHLDARHGLAALDEAMRVATRRVVIAVPYETEPTAAYGHVRTVGESDLLAWGRGAAGWTSSVHEHLGGWLVLDRCQQR
jgi:SAM-dependent methyltransferase